MITYLICSILWGVLAIMNTASIIVGSTPIAIGIALVVLDILLCFMDAVLYKRGRDKKKFNYSKERW